MSRKAMVGFAGDAIAIKRQEFLLCWADPPQSQ
jgi:hypothetical protein